MWTVSLVSRRTLGNSLDLAEDTLAFKNTLLGLVLIVFNFASKPIPTLLHMLWTWEDDFKDSMKGFLGFRMPFEFVLCTTLETWGSEG